MTAKEKEVYSKIYDISLDNLKAYGVDNMSNLTNKETLIASLDLEPDATDISMAYDVPRNVFVQAIFYITFKRWAQPDELEKIRDDSLSDRDYKRAVLRSVYESTERRIKNKVVYNYIDYTGEYTFTVGKFKRRIRMTFTKIKRFPEDLTKRGTHHQAAGQQDLPLISLTVTSLTVKPISALTALKKCCRADFTRLIPFSAVRMLRIMWKQ